MLTINNKTVEINKSLDLTPKQLLRYKSLESKQEQLSYLLSLLGKREHVRIDKPRSERDNLARKGTGSTLNRLQKMLDNGANVNHAPIFRSKNSQWVGVEIECYIDGANVDDDHCDYCDGSGRRTCYNCEGSGQILLTDDNGFEYEVTCASCGGDGDEECGECDGGYHNNTDEVIHALRNQLKNEHITNCSVRSDGSLRSGGVEICLLFDANKGFDKLARLCRILNDHGARINTDCGLHVHLDHAGRTREEIKAIGRHWSKFVDTLMLLQPPSRRNNRYCQPKASETDRYSAVNLSAFSKHKTIEVRCHAGSTNFDKIKNWIELLLCIKGRYNPKRPLTTIKTFQRFIDVVSLPPHLVEFYDKRLQKFNPSLAIDETNCVNEDNEECGECVA